MQKINQFFGILADGSIGATKNYRLTTSNRTELPRHKRSVVNSIIPNIMPPEARCFCANTCIELMKSSEYWINLVKNDPINTYAFKLEFTDDDLIWLPRDCDIDTMAAIAENIALSDPKYPIQPWFESIDYLTNTCFIILDSAV